jgi:hypothetical protein
VTNTVGAVPWCEGCQKFYSPNTLRPDGTCPEDHQVADPVAPDEEPAGRTGAPWHFWVLLVALVIYLGWRFVQGIGWLLG